MLLQTNSYVVPREKRTEHARLIRRFRQTLLRLGCDHFEVYEQVGANWSADDSIQRFVQILRFVDRKHQLAVQAAERVDPTAQAVIAEFCDMINFAVQQEKGLFAVGYYTSVLPVVPRRDSAGEIISTVEQEPVAEHAPISAEVVEEPPIESGPEVGALDSGILQTAVTELHPMSDSESLAVGELASEANTEATEAGEAPTLVEAETVPEPAISETEPAESAVDPEPELAEALSGLEPIEPEPKSEIEPSSETLHSDVEPADVWAEPEPAAAETVGTADHAEFEPLDSLDSLDSLDELQPAEPVSVEAAAHAESNPFESAAEHEPVAATTAETAAEAQPESASIPAAEPVSFDSILSAIEPASEPGEAHVFHETELTTDDLPAGIDMTGDLSDALPDNELVPEETAPPEPAADAPAAEIPPAPTVLRGQYNGEHLSPDDMLGDDVPPEPWHVAPAPAAHIPAPPLPVPGEVRSPDFFDKADHAPAAQALDDDFDISELEELPDPVVEPVDESLQTHGMIEEELLVEEEFEGSWEHAKPAEDGGHREPAKNPHGW
jgi:hypothetical protein